MRWVRLAFKHKLHIYVPLVAALGVAYWQLPPAPPPSDTEADEIAELARHLF